MEVKKYLFIRPIHKVAKWPFQSETITYFVYLSFGVNDPLNSASSHFHWLFPFLPRGLREANLGLLLTTWHLPPTKPHPDQDPLWATRSENCASVFPDFSFFIFAIEALAIPCPKQKAKQFTTQSWTWSYMQTWPILCHREWDWGQKGNTDIGAQSEGRNIYYPMDHCKASQLWLNIEQLGDLQNYPHALTTPLESLIERSACSQIENHNGTVMAKEISQAAPEFEG